MREYFAHPRQADQKQKADTFIPQNSPGLPVIHKANCRENEFRFKLTAVLCRTRPFYLFEDLMAMRLRFSSICRRALSSASFRVPANSYFQPTRMFSGNKRRILGITFVAGSRLMVSAPERLAILGEVQLRP